MSAVEQVEKQYHNCPFPRCDRKYTTLQKLRDHLLKLKGRTGGPDELHPADSSCWTECETNGLFRVSTRPNNLSGDEKAARRKAARLRCWNKNKDTYTARARQARATDRERLRIAESIANLHTATPRPATAPVMGNGLPRFELTDEVDQPVFRPCTKGRARAFDSSNGSKLPMVMALQTSPPFLAWSPSSCRLLDGPSMINRPNQTCMVFHTSIARFLGWPYSKPFPSSSIRTNRAPTSRRMPWRC